jgi:hypothetical protein
MANTKITQSKQEKASKAMPKGVKLMKEVKLEDVKSLLSSEALKNSRIGKSGSNDISIIYKDYKKMPYDEVEKLKSRYDVDEERFNEDGETNVYQYYISDKINESGNKNNIPKIKEILSKIIKENRVKLSSNSNIKLNENRYTSELTVDNIKNIIKDNERFYNEDKLTIEKLRDGAIYVSKNGDRLRNSKTILDFKKLCKQPVVSINQSLGYESRSA